MPDAVPPASSRPSGDAAKDCGNNANQANDHICYCKTSLLLPSPGPTRNVWSSRQPVWDALAVRAVPGALPCPTNRAALASAPPAPSSRVTGTGSRQRMPKMLVLNNTADMQRGQVAGTLNPM